MWKIPQDPPNCWQFPQKINLNNIIFYMINRQRKTAFIRKISPSNIGVQLLGKGFASIKQSYEVNLKLIKIIVRQITFRTVFKSSH